MKADRIVLGLALAAVGVVWLLVNIGVMSPVVARDLWRFWPLLLVLWGALLLTGRGSGAGGCLLGILVFLLFFGGIFNVYLPGTQGPDTQLQVAEFTVPADSEVEDMRLELLQSAGEVTLSSHSGSDFIQASLVGAPQPKLDSALSGNSLHVSIEDESYSWTVGNRVSRWDVQVAENISTEISLRTGAGRADLNLSQLHINRLDVKSGAGDLTVTLGEVDSQVNVEGGAGSITFYVPDNIGVRLETSGLLNVSGDSVNMVSLGKSNYESKDLQDKDAVVDIDVKTGVGSITLRSAR